jgi:hypothetical protein
VTMQGKNAAGLVTAGSCQVHETSPWWTCLISRAVPLTLPPLRRKELEGQAVVIMSGADTADSRPGEGKNAGGQAAVGSGGRWRWSFLISHAQLVTSPLLNGKNGRVMGCPRDRLWWTCWRSCQVNDIGADQGGAQP